MDNQRKTTIGLEKNLEALLCYLLGWVTGIIFLIFEKENRYVRFHAAQSVAVFLPIFVLAYALGLIPLFGILLGWILRLGGIVLWIFLMYKAFNGEEYRLPIASDMADKIIGGTSGEEEKKD